VGGGWLAVRVVAAAARAEGGVVRHLGRGDLGKHEGGEEPVADEKMENVLE